MTDGDILNLYIQTSWLTLTTAGKTATVDSVLDETINQLKQNREIDISMKRGRLRHLSELYIREMHKIRQGELSLQPERGIDPYRLDRL